MRKTIICQLGRPLLSHPGRERAAAEDVFPVRAASDHLAFTMGVPILMWIFVPMTLCMCFGFTHETNLSGICITCFVLVRCRSLVPTVIATSERVEVGPRVKPSLEGTEPPASNWSQGGRSPPALSVGRGGDLQYRRSEGLVVLARGPGASGEQLPAHNAARVGDQELLYGQDLLSAQAC